ncbi:unnamed protein product [Rotaria magnacalcarata]|uniref:Uncharacterized protein n=2 Tax=Rotaria magnacalcarata TaxID=392030 RepID=A0A816XG74_9BILA|nr:unnamed protein product [Rotaria magnacalcarata]
MSTNSRPKRYLLLPCYPTTSSDDDLLLTNVSIDELDESQLIQRQLFGYHQPTTYQNDHEQWIDSLSQSWNIHRDILQFNLKKMLTLLDQLAYKRMYHFSTHPQEETLYEDEYKIALEFYLQMDYNLFYMKTCSYRGAQPIINIPSSIFSTNERPPYGRYTMEACHQKSCSLCYPSRQIESKSTVQHIFVNGYRSILNCPATCTTQNIIYVLTCPCKQFDYIGETSVSLPQRLTYHRKHGNRIIKEFLLGKKLTNYINEDVIKSYETLVKDRMKLYQHLCYCSVAMQHFLDENSDYWSFIPQRLTVYEEQEQEREIKFVDHHQYQFANDVPVPTNTNYHFTTEQKLNIEEFFQQKKYLTPSNSHFDFYQASIIAVCKY